MLSMFLDRQVNGVYQDQNRAYHKVPNFSDARKLCCNLHKIQEKRPNFWVFCQKDANGKAKSGDHDQTARSSLIWVCTVCLDLSKNFLSLRYIVCYFDCIHYSIVK